MENQVTIFSNPQFGSIRTAGTTDEPLFCLSDVCDAIGINNSRAVKHRLGDDDVSLIDTIDNLGRTQQVTFVTESGLYDVIIRSDSEKAKPFRKWVTSEVLPTIRKHGMYATAEKIEQMLQDPENMIKVLTTLKEEREQRIAAEAKVAQLQAINDEQKTKVVFADAVIGSEGACLISELAKILAQNGVKVGGNRLFEWMRAHHYLGSSGAFYNKPNQRYVEQGLFELKKNTFSVNGVMQTTTTTKVTAKGQHYFINIFLSHELERCLAEDSGEDIK